MATTAEFEEKEYEQPLNRELLFEKKSLLWPPGQVFEEHFGVDAVLQARNPMLWTYLGYNDEPSGVILDHFSWGYIWRKTGGKRRLPTFRANLLLQTKRPSHRKGRNSKYAKHGISGEYWQFELTPHQQDALSKLDAKLKNRALVCYASAAFHTHGDLFTHIDNQSLVDNSTFVQIQRLVGHSKWVYNQPGANGLACSKIEMINDIPFRDLIQRQAEIEVADEGPLQNLLLLEKAAVQTAQELDQGNVFKREFERRTQIVQSYSDSENDRALKAFFTFRTFLWLTNTIWFAVG